MWKAKPEQFPATTSSDEKNQTANELHAEHMNELHVEKNGTEQTDTCTTNRELNRAEGTLDTGETDWEFSVGQLSLRQTLLLRMFCPAQPRDHVSLYEASRGLGFSNSSLTLATR